MTSKTLTHTLAVADTLVYPGAQAGAQEVALWLGQSPTHGRMSVTHDRDLFWVRFSGDLTDAADADMRAHGWWFSAKKRKGYFQTGTDTCVAHLRTLGYTQAQPLALSEATREQLAKRTSKAKPVTHTGKPALDTRKPASTPAPTDTPLNAPVRQLANGKWVDARGWFTRGPQSQAPASTPAPLPKQVQVQVPAQESGFTAIGETLVQPVTPVSAPAPTSTGTSKRDLLEQALKAQQALIAAIMALPE